MFCENNKYTIFYFDLNICQAYGFDDKDFTQVCLLKFHSLNYKKMKINLYVEDVMQGTKRNTLNAN